MIRTYRYGKEEKQALLQALRDCYGILSHACKKSNISDNTYYKWIKNDKDFKKQVERIREEVCDEVESFLFNLMKQGDTAGIIFYCKTRMRHRGYTEKDKRKPIEIPSLATIADLDQANEMLIRKLASTELSEEEVLPLQKLIMERRSILQSEDLHRRLLELEHNSKHLIGHH